MQTSILEKIFSLQDECTALGNDFKKCLAEERDSLIALKLDPLLHTASRKEEVMQELKKKRQFMRLLLQEHLGMQDSSVLDNSLEGEQAKVWRAKRFEWLKVWEQIKNHCESNHRLIEHSQKSLDFMVSHLKQLLGEHSVYSSQGKKVDSGSSGKVLEVRY